MHEIGPFADAGPHWRFHQRCLRWAPLVAGISEGTSRERAPLFGLEIMLVPETNIRMAWVLILRAGGHIGARWFQVWRVEGCCFHATNSWHSVRVTGHGATKACTGEWHLPGIPGRE